MKSFTKDLISNTSTRLIPGSTLSTFTKFLSEQLNLEIQWEVTIAEIPYTSMYQNVTEKKIVFFQKKFSKLSELYNLEPGIYPPITDLVKAMNNLLQ